MTPLLGIVITVRKDWRNMGETLKTIAAKPVVPTNLLLKMSYTAQQILLRSVTFSAFYASILPW
jgi:hypothetical protein